ncbi:TIGR03086 family metal-binding protein [Janibacter limosus]|uniref:TIGR03086 family metal-binding protein n=1 Tax=Janibacter limosus TaxID=53458 RepID=A0AC61U3Q5_9MICO|nr:TIGR03086 family metal-binding protein [Janibacter limosus]UUZ44665.1 TIGR03086 family metal-binding protein [Janibacter limosus]
MDQLPDFRPDLDAAQSWVTDLISAVSPAQLDAPTPCAEYDVRGLLQHISALPAKIAAVATGGNPRELPSQVAIDEDGVGQRYGEEAGAALGAWADDALLSTTVTAPWGPAPGAAAPGGFVMETVTHGWDPAVATGQDPEADPALAAKARAIGEHALAEAPRGPGMPFGVSVEAPVGAGPTTQLAAFLGRSRDRA